MGGRWRAPQPTRSRSISFEGQSPGAPNERAIDKLCDWHRAACSSRGVTSTRCCPLACLKDTQQQAPASHAARCTQQVAFLLPTNDAIQRGVPLGAGHLDPARVPGGWPLAGEALRALLDLHSACTSGCPALSRGLLPLHTSDLPGAGCAARGAGETSSNAGTDRGKGATSSAPAATKSPPACAVCMPAGLPLSAPGAHLRVEDGAVLRTLLPSAPGSRAGSLTFRVVASS